MPLPAKFLYGRAERQEGKEEWKESRKKDRERKYEWKEGKKVRKNRKGGRVSTKTEEKGGKTNSTK